MKSKYLVLALFLSAFIVACGDDDEPTPVACDTADLTYTNYAGAIIDASCATAGCHIDATLAGGFSMEGYENTKLVIGFNKIIGTINHFENFVPMPLGGSKLDDCTIDKLTAWIENDAPE